MKRLWMVEVSRSSSFTMAVVADNENEARLVATRYADEEEENHLWGGHDWYTGFVSEATDRERLEAADLLDSEPWGENDEDLTCAEWLSKREGPQPLQHLVPFCGGTWRLSDPWVVCDNCRATAPATLENLDAAWAENDAGRRVVA